MKKIDRVRKNNVYFADFETTSAYTDYFKCENNTKLLCFYIENLIDSTKNYTNLNLNQFFEYLSCFKQNSKIYFHNLDFDGDFILKFLAKNHYKAVNNIDGVNQFSFLKYGDKIYKITVNILNIENKPITIYFYDSLKMFVFGVKKLGEALGINEHKLDKQENTEFYNLEPVDSIEKLPQEFIESCKKDVKIVKAFYQEFEKVIKKIVNSKSLFNDKEINFYNYLTIESFLYDLQLYFTHFPPGFECKRSSWWWIDHYHFSEISQLNPVYKRRKIIKCEKGLKININQDELPFLLETLPFGDLHFYWDKKPHYKKVINLLQLRIKSARAKTNHIPLLADWNNYFKIERGEITLEQTVNSLDDFECYYFEEEFNFLKQFYDFQGVELIHKEWVASDRWLYPFANKIINFRDQAKIGQDKVSSLIFETISQWGYGKYIDTKYYDNFYICADEEEYKRLLKFKELQWKNRIWRVNETTKDNQLPHTFTLKLIPVWYMANGSYNRVVASYIAMLKRMKLFKAIQALGMENVIYYDNHSIFLKDYNEKNLKQFLNKNQDYIEKIEEFDVCYIRDNKAYLYKENQYDPKTKPCAINQRYITSNLTYTNFYREDSWYALPIESDFKICKCESGTILQWKNFVNNNNNKKRKSKRKKRIK
ncbi:MAG: hypothetical protein HUJ42_01855 [Malacoplasma sp.]|nr:hypothetical protein [Malacoplasma sp.]